MKIYTRTGDRGETALFGGGRVSKDNLRVAAYGDVDELNSALGAAMACDPSEFETALLESIQRDLFSIGGRLATPEPDKVAKALAKAEIAESRVRDLESAIDRSETELAPLSAFVLPGGSPKAAALHVARTVCRRAERSVVALERVEGVPPVVLIYLNRLSDLLFTLARLANRRAGVSDRIW
ncbi:MAG: cob(I)yrinic acid a,c-diamide adenosyltransferase [Gemmatimonadetes bacterium]|nr:cob(I)yrinic acid a,c-diamide adenosyltransferase [Gemmatimonadota bacterium]